MVSTLIIPCLPEIAFLALIGVLFLQSVAGGGRNGFRLGGVNWLPWGALVCAGVAGAGLGSEALLFHGAYRIDPLSQFFKLAVAVGFFFAARNALNQPTLEDKKRPDYLIFLALSAWGLMLLSSAVELVTIYVAMEISSYSLYAVIPLRARNKEAAEAAVKYIMFGAVATAVALYGFSYILATRHTGFIAELAAFDWSWAASPMAAMGLTLFLCGMFFKLALAPFHFWCPDVYEGASNETAAFVAALPKLGAVVVLARLAVLLQPGLEVTTILAVLGAVSMTFGNLAALAQRDLKRMLGYSSVSHAGYVMLGLVAGTAEGLAAAVFYIVVYMLMTLACFWVLCRLSRDGRNLTFEDLDGLYRREPVLALILAVAAFALVGLPPTAGFMGKLFLMTSAWNHGYDWLVVVAAVNTALALYYYLSMVRHAYTREGTAEKQDSPRTPRSGLIWGGVLAATLILLGTVPGPVFHLALAAGQNLLP